MGNRELDPNRRKARTHRPIFYYGAAIATKPYLERTFPAFGAPDIAKWRLLPTNEPCP